MLASTPEAGSSAPSRPRGSTSRVMPIFCVWFSLPLGDTYQASQLAPPLQKSELLDAIVAWLLARAARQPLLLVFEDLHWSDSTSRELLERLAGVVHKHSLVVVTTARPEFENPGASEPGSSRSRGSIAGTSRP